VTLRIRIVITLLLAVLLLAGVLVWASIVAQQHAADRFAETTLHSRELVWRGILQQGIASMHGDTQRMTRDRKLKDALRKGEQSGAQPQVDSIYSNMNALGLVERVAVFDSDGRYLATAGFPLDTQPNSAVKRVLQGESRVEGLIRDSDGVLLVTVAIPITYRGKLVGGGILMRSPAWSVGLIKERAESDAAFFVDGVSHWASDERLVEIRQQLLNDSDSDGGDSFDIVEVDGQYWVASRHPLRGITDEPLAELLVAEQQTASIQAQRRSNSTGLVVAAVVILFVLTGLYLYLGRLLAPLASVTRSLKRVAEGDLSVSVTRQESGEIGILEEATAAMVVQLSELITRIQEVTDILAGNAAAMAEQSRHGQASAANQKRRVEAIVGVIQQLEGAANHVIAQVERSSKEAEGAGREARNGVVTTAQAIKEIDALASHIQHTADVVSKLREESQNIERFLEMIQDVAEQTNLLALNAAIEAARAGDNGRGFAVVADEVRALSRRTTQSTDEIRSVTGRLSRLSHEAGQAINESVAMAKDTVEHSARTNSSLQEIEQVVVSVIGASQEIHSSTTKQGEMTATIVTEIDHVGACADETAEHAEHVMSSCGHVAELAEQLRSLVGRFRAPGSGS
jgi:methyl-accepting chemotaxis protein